MIRDDRAWAGVLVGVVPVVAVVPVVLVELDGVPEAAKAVRPTPMVSVMAMRAPAASFCVLAIPVLLG
jgi:hypothetical protein